MCLESPPWLPPNATREGGALFPQQAPHRGSDLCPGFSPSATCSRVLKPPKHPPSAHGLLPLPAHLLLSSWRAELVGPPCSQLPQESAQAAEWPAGKCTVSRPRPWALWSQHCQRALGLPTSASYPMAPRPAPAHPPQSARTGPNGRCLLPPLPGKPQIIDCASSEPQHIFIILPPRHLAGSRWYHRHLRREGRRERGHGCAPPPHSSPSGWGAELSQASGTALLTAAWLSLRSPAAHWRGVSCRPGSQGTVIAENVPEPGFPPGPRSFVATEVALWGGVS